MAVESRTGKPSVLSTASRGRWTRHACVCVCGLARRRVPLGGTRLAWQRTHCASLPGRARYVCDVSSALTPHTVVGVLVRPALSLGS